MLLRLVAEMGETVGERAAGKILVSLWTDGELGSLEVTLGLRQFDPGDTQIDTEEGSPFADEAAGALARATTDIEDSIARTDIEVTKLRLLSTTKPCEKRSNRIVER